MSRAKGLTSAANHTKWDELRLAMYALSPYPKFRCNDLNGYYSEPDGDWYYHFRIGGYETIRFTDILVETDEQRCAVLQELRRIGLAGHAIENGFRVYGYFEAGEDVDYF